MQSNYPNTTICIEWKTKTDKGERERARVMDCYHTPSKHQQNGPHNSGCRITASQSWHQPCAWLWHQQTNTHTLVLPLRPTPLSNLITVPQPAACVGRQQRQDWGRCRVSAILNFYKLNLSRTTWYCCSFNKWTGWIKALRIQTSSSLFTKTTVIIITLPSICLLTQKLEHSAHHTLPWMWRNTVEQTTVMESTMNTQLCPIKNPWQEQ